MTEDYRITTARPEHEDHTKDIDFGRASIRTRWLAGYTQAKKALETKPWDSESSPLQAVVVHEATNDT